MDLPPVEKARSWLATFLKHIFTGPDNETYAIDRVLWPLLMIYAMALQAVEVVINHIPLDIQKFAAGMSFMFTAGAIGIAAKNGAEPPAKK
jgi:hypothetical protein